jgi:hypothetical protein
MQRLMAPGMDCNWVEVEQKNVLPVARTRYFLGVFDEFAEVANYFDISIEQCRNALTLTAMKPIAKNPHRHDTAEPENIPPSIWSL